MGMIGPHVGTVNKHKNGISTYIRVSKEMIEELKANSVELENLDRVRIMIEKLSTKASSKPWAFKKKAPVLELTEVV